MSVKPIPEDADRCEDCDAPLCYLLPDPQDEYLSIRKCALCGAEREI